jgi:hypothetical protein
MDKIINITLIAIIIGLLIIFVVVGHDKQAKAECYKWQQQAETYPDFFLADWQQAQCDYHGILIETQ